MTPARELDELEDLLSGALDRIVIDGSDFDAPGSTGLERLDRSAELKHLGVRADFPDSVNEDLYDDQDEAWVHDTVLITLKYQLRTSGQLESRKRAHRLERLIRLAITGDAELQANRPSYRASKRAWPPTNGWYEIVQTFRCKRDAEVA